MKHAAWRRLRRMFARRCNESGKPNRIAEDVGYESEAAFNRAFKREYGLPPGLWARWRLGRER